MDNEQQPTPIPGSTQETPAYTPSAHAEASPAEPRRETGPIVGIIIILIVIVLGGLYLWGARLAGDETRGNDAETAETAGEIANMPDPALDNLNTQGTSDELGAIEDDLDATSLQNIDKELGDVNIELQF